MSKKPEDKVELAKTIAEQSKKVRKASEKAQNLLSRIVQFLSNVIDRIFFKAKYGGIVSLVIAVSLFLMVTSAQQTASAIRSSIELNNIEVEVLVNYDLYEVTGIPETVNAFVQGEFVDLTTLRNQGNYSVVIDLIGLTEGTHLVNLEPTDFSPRVRVALSPTSTEVVIRRKISVEYEFGYDFINTNKMEREYVLGEPTFDTSHVIVQASQNTIDQISHIKALIDVTEQSETFEAEARLVAYNQNGQTMDIDILPETVHAEVPVTSPNKQVPLSVNIIGEIPGDKAVSSLTLEQERITVYGPEDVLAAIESIEIPVNATSLTHDENLFVHSISLPQGIRVADRDQVRVEIILADRIEHIVEDSHIFFENNTNNYNVTLIDGQEALMDIVLSGAQNMIDEIDQSQLRVSIDLRGLEPGRHELQVSVTGPSPYVEYTPQSASIVIDIEE